MNQRAPLHLHFLAHPQSELGNDVASGLMARFVEPPVSGGLRVPVFFTPDTGDGLPPGLDGGLDALDLDAAMHSIVVVLIDARMARTVDGGTGDAWEAFIADAIRRVPFNSTSHHILPVVLEPQGFDLGGQAHFLPALLDTELAPANARNRQLSDISLQVAARALRLLQNEPITDDLNGRVEAPVSLFISHAKADRGDNGDDPAKNTMDALVELPIRHWFDAARIETSEDFAEKIREGIEEAAIVVAFHTDSYDTRPWCRLEVLAAKQAGAQLLLVDALKNPVARQFPYLGNVPSVCWQFDAPVSSARRVVDRAVLEALRLRHNSALLTQIAKPGDIVLVAPPEALTLAQLDLGVDASATLLYPDPPLGHEELTILERLRPNATFTTPLSRMARDAQVLGQKTIAVSISPSNDIARFGMSPQHQQTLTDEIHLYLLLAGHAIAYGGKLEANNADPENFTMRLFDLVRSYAPLAATAAGTELHKIVNMPPWPQHLDLGEPELNLFGRVAELVRGGAPDLPWAFEDIFPERTDGKWRLQPDGDPEQSARKRYAWARGLSVMRSTITEHSYAKVVIGGRLRGFLGVVPGVVEEAWWSLKYRRPLYLVGSFGGCARAVSDMLMGKERPEFSLEDARATVSDYQACADLYLQHGSAFASMEQMGDDIRALRANGLAGALNNGLSDAENEELIFSSDPTRIAALVLRGLSKLG